MNDFYKDVLAGFVLITSFCSALLILVSFN